MTAPILRVAVPVPLRKTFDFLPPQASLAAPVGARVRVPFGRRHLVSVVTAAASTSEIPHTRLKPVLEILDPEPLLPESLRKLIQWVADYYHYPIGEVWYTAIPAALRRGAPIAPRQSVAYHLTERGRTAPLNELRRAPAKLRLIKALRDADSPLGADQLAQVASSWRQLASQLRDLGWLTPVAAVAAAQTQPPAPAPSLNPAQQTAVGHLTDALGRYSCSLLFGITGSGKTEVYLQLIDAVVRRGDQALVLVPEIGLTPQLVERFRQRFPLPIVVLHSGLADGERHAAWWRARTGEAAIVLGTRSAVFTPLARPGVIVVDEEHDLSFKQQDGLRYHARDVAVYRARLERCPVVLGSATPSLETFANARGGRYKLLQLPARTGVAQLPRVEFVDLRQVACEGELSKPLVDAVRARIEAGEQSLIFLNRRGFAPVLYCVSCSWQACCPRCDARLIWHQAAAELRCHHCGTTRTRPEGCPACGGDDTLRDLGSGTQRIENDLAALFASARVLRIDRDSTQRKGELAQRLAAVGAGDADILVGTQMLAKGHDFPRVTLVGVLNADQGLFSIDFRAAEHLTQQILQVAGRAGRGTRAGVVLIQTTQPHNSLFAPLRQHDYQAFAELALAERAEAGQPPFRYLALLRAESTRPGAALGFLRRARARGLARGPQRADILIMDAVASPMEKRAGRYRAQLLVSAAKRRHLHGFLTPWLAELEQSPAARRVRWSVDVDPMEMY